MNHTLIPTYEPGQRVLVTPKPNPEYDCPECGVTYGEDGSPFTATVIAPAQEDGQLACCGACGTLHPCYEGEYDVTYPDGGDVTVPWTWLSPIDTEEE